MKSNTKHRRLNKRQNKILLWKLSFDDWKKYHYKGNKIFSTDIPEVATINIVKAPIKPNKIPRK